jgi:hypothetical protein
VGFDVTSDQIFCIRKIQTVHQLFVDFNKAYNSVRREVLYNEISQAD